MQTPRQDACRGFPIGGNAPFPLFPARQGPGQGAWKAFSDHLPRPKGFGLAMFPRFLYPGPRLPQHGQGRIGGLAGGAAAGIQQGPAQILV